MRLRLATFLLAIFLGGAPAAAQLPPYAAQMERLAEILGSLHFLTGLCDESPSPWRDAMLSLLVDEAPEDAFAARLIDRFNLGYSSFAAAHRQCSATAEAAIERYRSDGAAIAARLNAEFGEAGDGMPPRGE